MLAPDARWYGVKDGQLCEGRRAIIGVMSRNLAGRLRGRIEETIQEGSRGIVAFCPEQSAQLDRPVDDGHMSSLSLACRPNSGGRRASAVLAILVGSANRNLYTGCCCCPL